MTDPNETRRYALPLLSLIIFVLAVVAGQAGAQEDHDHGSASVSLEGSPVANTGTGIVYLSILNNGTTTDRLIAAHTDAAQDVSLHASGGGGDVMRMAEQPDGFMIEPGDMLTLEPGGAHLMLENLNHDLRPSSTFAVVLTFEVAGEIEVQVAVGGEALDADPNRFGVLEISPAWSLPAPRLGDGPPGTPEATPHDGH